MISTYSFVISFTILQQYVDGLGIKNIADNLVPQTNFERDVIQYNLQRDNSSSNKWEILNLILHGEGAVTIKGVCPQTSVINSSTKIKLANDFECITVNYSSILAVMVHSSPFREVWPVDKSYCSNSPPNLEAIPFSIDNFCHLDSYSKFYKTVKIIFYDYPNIIKKSLKFKANGYVNERKWFKQQNYLETFPEGNLNYSEVFQMWNWLVINHYFISIRYNSGYYSVQYLNGSPVIWFGLRSADYAVIYGIV
ncbi:hypothetical protein SNEBB_010142 [Seison nebaliae]|nr:hypothetical protein SNEBB_010142 [Seison nebaliae]